MIVTVWRSTKPSWSTNRVLINPSASPTDDCLSVPTTTSVHHHLTAAQGHHRNAPPSVSSLDFVLVYPVVPATSSVAVGTEVLVVYICHMRYNVQGYDGSPAPWGIFKLLVELKAIVEVL
ncbi:hypothetical protein EV702DRAFT_1043935 [Suillus placidus]|uniref:Uncharacterized protein n=1 Tax=Suillus placidus TaxID=48579 RepID=A0A9P7D4P3_9AGAM|nr:hypothetical protein EV702DRAFT_1043935 [Suillus placidus]